MKRITLLFCLCFGTATIAQVSVKDTVQWYTNLYENGSISLFTLDTTMSNFFSSLPSDDVTTHYEKVFKRSMYFWKDRTYVNTSGIEQPDLYTSSMIEYLETPNCPNGDEAAWEFDFDPSPVLGAKHIAGIITAVYMNPSHQNIILAGAGASGIWYTETGGSTWENVTDHFGLPALGIQKIINISKPTEPEGKFLIAATGQEKFHDAYGVGVLKSSDYGKTWTRHAIPEVGGKIQYLVGITKPAGSSDLIYAASQYNIFVSTDRGLTWSLLTGQPTLNVEEYYSIEASETDLIVTSTGQYGEPNGDVWKLNFGTNSWTNLTGSILEDVLGYYPIDLAGTELFVSSFGIFEQISVTGLGGAMFVPGLIDYGVDKAVRINPVMDGAGTYSQQLGIKKNFEENIPPEGSLIITLHAEIPEGASLIVNFNGLPYAPEIESDGSGLLEYTVTIDLSELDILEISEFALKAGFDDEIYDLDAKPPIIIADVDYNLDIEITPSMIGAGISNLHEDEIYLHANTNIGLSNNRKFYLKSNNNGLDWELLFTEIGDLATRNVLTAGYGSENGFYYGDVDFHSYNFFTGLFNTIATKHDDVRSIQIIENIAGLNTIIVGDDGGVSFSEDNGNTWTSLNGDYLPITQFYGIGLHPTYDGNIVGGTQDNSTFLRNLDTWTNVESGDGGFSGFLPTLELPNRYFYQANGAVGVRDGEVDMIAAPEVR